MTTGPTTDVTVTRRVVAAEWADLADRLDALPGAEWDRPTGLAGWRVRDLARHAVWGVSMEAEALRRARVGDHRPADGRVIGSDDRRVGSDAAEIRVALAVARRGLDDALDGAEETLVAEDTPVPLAAGLVPWAMVRAVLAMEAGIHADDLRLALGEDRDLAPEVVASTVAFLQGFAGVLGAAGAAPPPVGTRIGGRSDTLAVDLLVTPSGWDLVAAGGHADGTIHGDDTSVVRWLMGRPDPRRHRTRVTGDAGLVDGLKRWFPGP